MTTRHCRAFTLLEVLIAMTLLSIMVTLLFGSLRIAAQSWNAGENKVAEVNAKAVVYQFFKRHLTAVRPLPMPTNPDTLIPSAEQAFQGRSQALRFVAALPAASARKGLQIFRIGLDANQKSTLLVGLKPYQQADTENNIAEERPEVLLKDIAALKFSYFGKTEDMADAQWREDWRQADRLPALIKVSIQLADDSYWPDMVFPLKITQTAAINSLDENDLGDEAYDDEL